MSGFRKERPGLEKHIEAIGHVCIEWSYLEGATDYLIGRLIPINSGQPLDVLTTNIDFRSKLQIVKGLGISHSLGWQGDLLKLVDYVDNTLRPARNRYVHDAWVTRAEGPPLRLEAAMRIRKAQAHSPLVVETINLKPTDIEEMWSIIRRIGLAAGWIWQAAVEHDGQRPAPPLPQGVFDE